jgi:hypothetical protein
MTTSYVITDQEYRLLDFVAYGEVAGSPATQYNLVNGEGVQPLTEMSIREVIDRFGAKNFARGRYQFIGETLISLVDQTGLDRNLRFSEEVQDFLGLKLLHQAKLEAWKQGRCTDTGNHKPNATTNHTAFLMNLARIWAAKPIPIAINERKGYARPIDSTYYPGPNNRAKGTSSAHLSDLEAIYATGPGQAYTINFGETSRPYPSQGRSINEQAEVAAGGGQNYRTQGRPHANSIAGSLRDLRSRGVGFATPLQPGAVNPGRPSPAAGMLPQVSNPYLYKRIDPLDNRYDFRTGEKVIDLLINGTKPASTYPINEDMRRYGDPNTPATQIDAEGEFETSDDTDYDLPDGDTSPPTGKTGDPYAPSEFDPGEYVVNAIVPNSRPNGQGAVAVIRSTGKNRAGEFVVGQEIYRARSGSPDDVNIITITAIDPAAKTVTLSDGTILQASGPYGQGSGKINEKINEVAPPDEIPSGDYKPIRSSIQNDLKTLNSKVREISPFVTVVPVDVGDDFVYYISSDYYRDSSNQYPAAAYSPSPARVAGVVYATDIAKQLGGELPSKDLVGKIDGKADKKLSPPSISPTDPKYTAEVNKIIKQAGIVQGEIVSGIKTAIDASNSGAGSTKPNNADLSKGIRISWGKISKVSGVRSGPITTLRS